MSERLHVLGAYTIRMERKGSSFVYDVLKHNSIVACGIDARSSDEETALQGIVERFGIAERKMKEKQ